ncbi:MAG TPA: SIMPL domain-containing protein [Candidatus Paceibacterota bacterium]|nr:SIMPL domain-containing protein [Candidatus Paceibacterota bacterium]
MNEENKNCVGCKGKWHLKKALAFLAIVLSIFVLVKIIGEIKSLKYIGGTNEPATIVVNGTGEIDAIPDTANFSFSVTEEAASVGDAQTQASTKTNAIIAYLEKNGVAQKDIQTTDYSISPRYNYINQTPLSSGTRVLAGYDVSESVSVKVETISSAGALLSGIGGLGAEDVSDLTFTESNHDDLVKQAEAKAITDARTNAARLAQDLGVSLSRIVGYSNNQSIAPGPLFYAQAMSASSDAAVAPTISQGQNTITANVSITYEIQ